MGGDVTRPLGWRAGSPRADGPSDAGAYGDASLVTDDDDADHADVRGVVDDHGDGAGGTCPHRALPDPSHLQRSAAASLADERGD